MTRPWDGIIPPDDLARYAAAGFGGSTGFGDRPALVIIDVQFRTTGTRSMPYWQAIEEFKTSCGDAAWDALPKIVELLAAFRARGLPVLYPYVAQKEVFDGGRLGAKVPTIMAVPTNGYAFPPDIAPAPGDVLIPKKHPSAFFGTPLASYLIERAIDTLVVTGCSTSGCVRSTVSDAFALNYRVTVPYDAVYDRSPTAHAVNLFDMAYKYADVCPSQDVLALL